MSSRDEHLKEAPLSALPSRDRAKLESWIERYQDYGKLITSAKSKQDTIKNEQIEPLRQCLGYDIISADSFKIVRQPGRESLDQSLLIRQMLEMGLAVKNETGRYVAMTAEEIVSMIAAAKKRGEPFTEIKRVGPREKTVDENGESE